MVLAWEEWSVQGQEGGGCQVTMGTCLLAGDVIREREICLTRSEFKTIFNIQRDILSLAPKRDQASQHLRYSHRRRYFS